MFDEGVIERVDEDAKGYTIMLDGSSGFGLSKEHGVIPKVGDYVKLMLIHGSEIRGLHINGKLVFFKSDEQLATEHAEWAAKFEKERQERYDKNRGAMDLQYASLPLPFRKRIDRFRRNNPRFRVEFEGYELFCCEEAVKIAAGCGTPDAVKRFHDMTTEEQKALVPTLDDGHSGNTFGMACALAYLYASDPDKVWEMHGAMSVLVGSQDYGDIEPPESDIPPSPLLPDPILT